MENFEFYSPTRFVFGRESERQVGDLVRRCGGTRVLLHFGGGSVKRTGVYDKVVASLEAAGVSCVALGGVRPNPRSGLVRQGIELCRREKVDFVLAVGGGSVIDSAKAIAFGTVCDEDFANFYFGKDVKAPRQVPKALPVGVVLTIAAAGSEGSANSILNLEPDNLKRGATGEALRPKFAILNPEFTYTLPPFQTACGAVDIFAHVVERYFTPSRDVRVSDELCEGLMRSVVAASVCALERPDDYAARSDLMWAGSLAHNNVCGAGRIQDWASHGIEHEISALTDCAHGAGLAVVMPAWMDYVKKADLDRFVRFAEKVWNVPPGQPETVADEGIARYRAWIRSLGLPTTLEELGVRKGDVPALVSSLRLNGNTLGSFMPLHEEDVANILLPGKDGFLRRLRETVGNPAAQDPLVRHLRYVPYSVTRESLYAPRDLFEAYDPADPSSVRRCFDARVYRHVLETGVASESPFELAARTLHDCAVRLAMSDFLKSFDRSKVVGIMGGHALSRTSAAYRTAVDASKRLTERGFLMISGGGPGAMEATHLGAWMAGRRDNEVDEALRILADAPTAEHADWFATAFAVTRRFPQGPLARSLAIPTWFFGQEPPTVFATHIAKFFENSIREDALLTESYGGLVFMEGGAGTVQEVFQEVVQDHYLTLGVSSPLVFVGRRFWTEEVPVLPFLRQMVDTGRYRNLDVRAVDTTDEIIASIDSGKENPK